MEMIMLVLLVLLGVPLLAFAENTMLPDGTVFQSWEVEPTYTRTYHVAQKAPHAADDNPGTAEQPWRTLGPAAAPPCILTGEIPIANSTIPIRRTITASSATS